MQTNPLSKTTLGTLSIAALMSLTSCSSTPVGETSASSHFKKGVPGFSAAATTKLTATVTGIDAVSRKVTLVTADGKRMSVKCGPYVLNFNQIQVGDRVYATVTTKIAVAMAHAGSQSGDGGETVLSAPGKVAKPRIMVAETEQFTATVTAINLPKHQATLRFADGRKQTFNVRADVDLTQRKVGEKVVFRTTIATAVSVEKQ